ncbi:MAG: glycosyltransferase family 4 protein [Parcubacteria group bacterium]
MKILITSGLSEKDIGGPFQYGPRLREAFQDMGHEVKLVSYGRVEKLLPIGLRHIYFFFKILPKSFWADYTLTLDTFSVGVPTVLTSSLYGSKCVVRVGGDFLWSAYVNRTGLALTLPDFYDHLPKLSLKERVVKYFTEMLIDRVDFLAFNTLWQKKLWDSHYKIQSYRSGVVRNFIPKMQAGEPTNSSGEKNFLWAGRLIPEKNVSMLKKFNIDVVTGESREKVLEKIKECHAVVSLAFTDICPNFILEGISYGKPFIMTRETGLKELYPKGGVFLDPTDEEAWIETFENILKPEVYNGYVDELKSLNISHSWEEMAEEYIKIWKAL